jgi:iron complex outermembrane recepter protein
VKSRTIAIATASLLATPAIQAAEDPVALPAMTVTQSLPAVIADNPSPQAQVTQEQMREMNVVNVEDSLQYTPSLFIRKRYIGDRNGIIATRTSGSTQSARSLVYADGLLLSNLLGNTFSYPPRWNIIGAEEIDTIDVLYGPFSAMLPGNSAGATILMTTRRPKKLEAHGRVQGFTQNFKVYGTEDTYSGYQAQGIVGGRIGDLSWSLFANHLDTRAQPMNFATADQKFAGPVGGTAVTNAVHYTSATETPRVMYGATSIDHSVQDVAKIRLAYDFAPDTRAALTYATWRNDSFTDAQTYLRNAAGRPVWSGAVNIGGFQYTVGATTFAPTDSDTENRLFGLTLDSRVGNDWRIEVAASDYATPTDVARTPGASDNTLIQPGAVGANQAGTITFSDDTGWRNLDLKAIWKPGQGKAGHTVTFGYHWDEYRMKTRQYTATHWRSDASTTTLRSHSTGRTSTTALFIQDAWKFDPRWTATLGMRHERWEAFDGTRYNSTAFNDPNGVSVNSYAYPERNDKFNSPKASLAWQATNDWLLRASLARAYRMPTVVELFQTESRGGATFISDPNLKPEKVLAKDLTAEGDALGGLLRISAFEEHIDDALYSQTDSSVTPNITSVQNLDRIRVRGLETAWQANDVWLRGLDISGSLTYARSKILANRAMPTSVGKRVPRIPDWRASVFATYRVDAHWSGSLGMRYSGRQFGQLDNRDTHHDDTGGVGSYRLVDVRVNYRFGKLMRASLGIDNLTNEKYFIGPHPFTQRTLHAELRIDY